jgi:uncharacterized protein (DUF2267 family)
MKFGRSVLALCRSGFCLALLVVGAGCGARSLLEIDMDASALDAGADVSVAPPSDAGTGGTVDVSLEGSPVVDTGTPVVDTGRPVDAARDVITGVDAGVDAGGCPVGQTLCGNLRSLREGMSSGGSLLRRPLPDELHHSWHDQLWRGVREPGHQSRQLRRLRPRVRRRSGVRERHVRLHAGHAARAVQRPLRRPRCRPRQLRYVWHRLPAAHHGERGSALLQRNVCAYLQWRAHRVRYHLRQPADEQRQLRQLRERLSCRRDLRGRHVRLSGGAPALRRRLRRRGERRAQLRLLRSRVPRGPGLHQRRLRMSGKLVAVPRRVRRRDQRQHQLRRLRRSLHRRNHV